MRNDKLTNEDRKKRLMFYVDEYALIFLKQKQIDNQINELKKELIILQNTANIILNNIKEYSNA